MTQLDKLVTVTLDKERHLRLTLKGLIEFEKLTGKNLLKGFDLGDLTLEDSAALIWACLLYEDRGLTFDDVLYMVDLSNLAVLMNAVTECISQSLPEVEVTGSPLAEKSPPG